MNQPLQPATRNSLLLFLGCFLFHLAGSWSLPLIDRDEPRFAEAAREMRERGDYVVPWFNNGYRFDKPPLTYWAQIASYRLLGETDFAARLPSALAAAGTSWLLLLWGRRAGTERTGFAAALIFALCLQTFVHARAAVADMWLTFFVTLAHWAGFELLRGGRPRFFWWLFHPALAFAFLAKGPIGWTPLLAVALYGFLARHRSAGEAVGATPRHRRFHFPIGLALMLLLVGAWAGPALLRTDGEFFRIGIGRHVVERSVASMEGHGARSFGLYLLTLPFFFVTLFASFFPWSLRLPALFRSLRQNRDALDRYLLCGSGLIFVIFSLVATKLPHYTLPALPLLALLLAKHWTGSLRRWAGITAAALFLFALVAPPLARPFFPSIALLEAARPHLRPEMEFGAVGYQEPSLVWYFRRHINGWMTPLKRGTVAPFMAQPGPRFVVLPTRMVEEIAPPAAWKQFRVEGFNLVKGRRVDLTLLLKEE